MSKKQKLINVFLILTIILVFGATAWIYLSQCENGNCPEIAEFIQSFGIWAPIAYGVIYIATSPVPFLAPLLSAAGGLLFGAVPGMLYTIFIASISALIPFTIARQLGKDLIEEKLQGRNLEDIYKESEGEKGFIFVLLLRLIPVLPWEIQNYVSGLTKVKITTFLLATLLGIIPGTFSLTFLGSAITDPTSWKFFAAIGLKIITALIPAAAVYFRKRNANKKEISE